MDEHPVEWKNDDRLWDHRHRKEIMEAMRTSAGDGCGFTKRGIGFEALKRSILRRHSDARMPNSKARSSDESEETKKLLKGGNDVS